MKKFSWLVLGVALVAATPGSASHEGSEKALWGVKELKASQDYALNAFLDENGQDLFDAISGLAVDRQSSGDAARVKLTYVVNGVKRTASYFCHTHDTDIDCH